MKRTPVWTMSVSLFKAKLFSIVAQYAQYVVYSAGLKWDLILPAFLRGNLPFWGQFHRQHKNTETSEKIWYPSVHHLSNFPLFLFQLFLLFSLSCPYSSDLSLYIYLMSLLAHSSLSTSFTSSHIFSPSVCSFSLSLCFPLHQCYHTVLLM